MFLRRNRLLPLLGVLTLALFLRIYRLPENFVFGVDEEYQAYLAQALIKNFHLIWVGVSSTADFYLGPAWTYLTAGLLFFSRGDPLITGYLAAFLGVATTAAVFLVGSKLFGYRTGILASLLYATLPLIVFFDQKYWNVSAVPFLSLVLLYAIHAAQKNEVWWIVFAFAYGLVFHTHLSLAPIGIVALVYLLRQRKKIQRRTYLLNASVFLLIISPLLVFDYFHKWSNLTVPIRLISSVQKSSGQIDFGQKTLALGQSLGRLTYLAPQRPSADENNWGCTLYAQTKPALALSVFLLLVLVWFLFKQGGVLRWVIITYLASFLLFPGPVLEYYLLGLFPLLLFIPGRKFFPVAISLVVSLLGIYTVVTARDDYGLAVKRQLVSEVVKVIGNEPFELVSEGQCHIAEGWRYLFSVYGRKPVVSSTDQIFGWLYPEEISSQKAKYLVVMAESRVPLGLDTSRAKRIEGGGFTAFISPKE